MINQTNAQVELFRTASVAGAHITDSVFLKRARLENGTAGVQAATGAKDEAVVGIAFIRAIATRFATVVKEQHVVDSTLSIILPRVPVLASIEVFNATKAAKVDPTKIDWTGAKGTAAADAGVAATDVLEVTYRYEMSMLELQAQGLPIDFANQITGNDGKVEFATGRINVEVDLFDTHAEYNVDDKIYVSAEGIPTTTENGAPVGRVTAEPTAASPVLGFSAFFVY